MFWPSILDPFSSGRGVRCDPELMVLKVSFWFSPNVFIYFVVYFFEVTCNRYTRAKKRDNFGDNYGNVR